MQSQGLDNLLRELEHLVGIVLFPKGRQTGIVGSKVERLPLGGRERWVGIVGI